MYNLKRKIRSTIPALIYALGFMVVLILSAIFSEEIQTVPIIGMIMTTALVVFYVLAIYFLFRTASDIHLESTKAKMFSFFWFVVANICIMYIAGSSFVGALGKTTFEDVEVCTMYNILIGWIVATHIARTVSTHLFDLMVGMMAWLVIFSLFFSVSAGMIPNLDLDHVYMGGAILVFAIAYFLVVYLRDHIIHKMNGNHKKRKKK
jgi:hypothetical protein